MRWAFPSSPVPRRLRLGNFMIQALPGGAARDVASMRQLINRSIPLKTFHPQDMEVWDTAYLHFGQLTADK